ncbi:MAG: esterase/lipase family protein, partial [Planctomycetota bacterium]
MSLPATPVTPALLTVAICCAAAHFAIGQHPQPDREPPSPPAFEMTLSDGRLDVAHLLRSLCEVVEMPPPAALNDLDWTIDVQSAVKELELEELSRATRGAIRIRADEDRLAVYVDRKRMADLQPPVRAWLTRQFDGVHRATDSRYGLFFITEPAGVERPLGAMASVPDRVVVLVHGLDDPGWLWKDVIQALRAAGYTVARVEYPNDGPIAEGADLLAAKLEELRTAGVEHVDLVVHSMGGLVSRDVLTRKAYYDGDGSGGERFPAVDRLIMLGTPNHGSQLVRLRFLAELAEHFGRAWKGEAGALDMAADGRGEAAVDLLPGSVFLTRLNARPLATHTRHTIVAGHVSPVDEGQLKEMLEQGRALADRDDVPGWVRTLSKSINSGLLGAAVRTLGDGTVSIDSAKLEGVEDFVVIEADHIGMIVNVAP